MVTPGIIKLRQSVLKQCSTSFISEGMKILPIFCQSLSDPVDMNNMDNNIQAKRRTSALGPASCLQTQQQV